MMRIPFDSLTLRAVTGELQRNLIGGQVQRVAQPAPEEIILTIRNRGANHSLLLSCDPVFARVHLTAAKRPNPAAPPAFCMICRKYLEGAIVTDVSQRGFDRILDIFFDGTAGKTRLVAELMGKHSNLILVSESGFVLDAAKRITRKLSRVREIIPGAPYLAPPAQPDRTDPFSATREELQRFVAESPTDSEALSGRLMSRFAGLSPFLASELARRLTPNLDPNPNPDPNLDPASDLNANPDSLTTVWQDIFRSDDRWSPVLVRGESNEPIGAYPLPSFRFPPESQHALDSINTAVDQYHSLAIPRAELDADAHALSTAISRAMRAREKKQESLRRSLEESARAEELKQAGELLLANLHRIEPGVESTTVPDYYSPEGAERLIPLDSRLTPQQNAEAYFRRYRKAKSGAVIHREHLDHVREDLRFLDEAGRRLSAAHDITEVESLKRELASRDLLRGEKPPGTGKPERRPDFQGKRIRVFNTPEGWDIYLGENSEANDYLTGRVAAPNDLWLHVRSSTSAHVVIRTKNNPSAVPQSVIQRAAVLAAQHSAAKHSNIVPVDYTLKKHVRRPRGARSGTVTYSNEKTIHVSPR